MIDFVEPPKLWIPERPAIIRPGVDLARYFPVELDRHSRRAIVSELVKTGRVEKGAIPFGMFSKAPITLSPFSLTYIDSFTTNPGFGTSFNDTLLFGAAPTGSDTRELVVIAGLVRSGSNSFTSVYIGGILATQVGSTYSTTNVIIGMFIATVPGGTSGNVQINVGSSSLCCTVSLARMINRTSALPADIANDTVSVINLPIDIPTGGAAFAATQSIDGVAMTWANATEVYEIDARTGEYFSAAISTTPGTNVAISATGSATNVIGMAASFS